MLRVWVLRSPAQNQLKHQQSASLPILSGKPKEMTKNSNKSLRSWLSWGLLVTIFSTSCWFLSQWQFSRQTEVHESNLRISANYEQKPVALEALLKSNQAWVKSLEFRSVTVSGSYLPDRAFLIRNRPYESNPGFLQLVAFETDGGSIIWVERGWLPTGSRSDSPDDIPRVNDIHRQITIRLRPAEPELDRTAPSGQLPSIDLLAASDGIQSNSIYTQAYGRLVSEDPKLERGLVIAKPDLSDGNHLSYAFQWILFGLMALGAVLWTLSQERRRSKGLPPRKLKSLNRDKDAEVEDQILNRL
jgi:cytochrome oxidase assembly protein ShyY1